MAADEAVASAPTRVPAGHDIRGILRRTLTTLARPPARVDPAAARRYAGRAVRSLAGPVLVGLAAWFGFCVRLLWGTPVGVADQGDAQRLMCPIGLAPDPVDHRPFINHAFYNFVNVRWDTIPPSIRSTMDCGYGYRTSERRVVLVASWISRHLGFTGALDLRVLAVFICFLISVAFALLVAGMRSRWPFRLLVAAVLWIVVADSAFLPYALSAYSEIAGLTGMLFALAGAVYLASGSSRRRLVGLVIFTGGAAFAILSKVQAATLIVPCLIYLLAHEVPIGRLKGRWLARIPSLAAVVVLLVSALHVQAGEGYSYTQANRYNFVFLAMLGPSQHRTEDIVAMGGNPELVKWADGRRDFWEVGAEVLRDPNYKAFESHMTLPAIGGFLLEHPSDLDNVLNDSANSFTDARPNYLGNYPADTGHKARAQESRISVVTKLLHKLPKDGLPVLAGLWAAIGAAGWWASRRRPTIPVGRVVLLFLGFAVIQFITATVGDGIEITKHEVFGVFATALAAAWALVGLLGTARVPQRWVATLPVGIQARWPSRPRPDAAAGTAEAAADATTTDLDGERDDDPDDDGEPGAPDLNTGLKNNRDPDDRDLDHPDPSDRAGTVQTPDTRNDADQSGDAEDAEADAEKSGDEGGDGADHPLARKD